MADDILEFHAGRLLLLLMCCGTQSRELGQYRIDGLTKMAKLDFFVRYPQFFARVDSTLGEGTDLLTDTTESAMVRYHYGPWDPRYYHLLAYLEGRRLISVTCASKGFCIALTPTGAELASRLQHDDAFTDLRQQMLRVKRVLGHRTGTALKNLIYKTFDKEIAQRDVGEVID